MRIVNWFTNQGFEVYDRKTIKEFNKDTSHYSVEENDLTLIWERLGRKVKTFRFRIISKELIEKDIISNYDRYQFIIIKKSNIGESKVLRHGTIKSYCTKILSADSNDKIKQNMIDISGMKHYVTLDEFIPWIAKVKLIGFDYSQQEFWSAFRFPRR